MKDVIFGFHNINMISLYFTLTASIGSSIGLTKAKHEKDCSKLFKATLLQEMENQMLVKWNGDKQNDYNRINDHQYSVYRNPYTVCRALLLCLFLGILIAPVGLFVIITIFLFVSIVFHGWLVSSFFAFIIVVVICRRLNSSRG